MFVLYIANKNYSSWSLRPWVLLKALEIPFNEHLMPFEGGVGESHTTFKRFSPSGLVPCLIDSEHDVAVWDSLAIIEYVAEKHPSVWPEERAARAWARSASAEMHSGFGALRDECSMNCGRRGLRVLVARFWQVSVLLRWTRFTPPWRFGYKPSTCR